MVVVRGAVLLVYLVAVTRAFVPQRGASYRAPLMLASVDCDDTDCVVPDFDNALNMPGAALSHGDAILFRNSILTDVDGNAPQVESKGAVGPLFISIGDSTKLQKFLELNPLVPRNQAFVDDYEFAAYKAVGLRKMDREYKVPEGAQAKMTAPNMGGIGGWWNYLKNSMKLSPIPEGKGNQFPEGVLMLGGTFVIDGDDVVYSYEDPLPGVEPDLAEVMNAL